MAKIVFCFFLAVMMVAATHARLIPTPREYSAARYQTSHHPGRLVSTKSFDSSYGSTEVQRDSYQASFYNPPSRDGEFEPFDRMQEDDTTTSSETDTFSSSFASEAFQNSFPDISFSTESNDVNPDQGVHYSYAADTENTGYDKGLAIRGAGAETGTSFTLEGNTEKTDSAEWTESSDP